MTAKKYPSTINFDLLAPDGWRVASSSDFMILMDNNGGSSVGGKMKDTSFGVWDYPNTDASNCLKFNSLPFGTYNNYGVNTLTGEIAVYLTSSNNISYTIYYNNGTLQQSTSYSVGLIRLIKE